MYITSISKKYPKAKDYALKNINLHLKNQGFTVITGKSGSGKSTLIQIISGLDTDYEGTILYKQNNLKQLSKKELNAYRNSEIGYIFQDFCLIEHKTIYENLKLVLEINQRQDEEIITSTLEKLGIAQHANKYPNELSGGEQQRVSIARALLKNPNIIIADEPTSALDEENAILILQLLKEISKEKLVLLITHQTALIQNYADRIITLDQGSILSDSNPLDVQEVNENLQLHSAKLSFKNAFHLSYKIKLNKFKLGLSLISFILCFMLTIVCLAFSTMDKEKILLQSMYDNQEYVTSIALKQDMFRTENTENKNSFTSAGYIPRGVELQLQEKLNQTYLKVNPIQYAPTHSNQLVITLDEETIQNGQKKNTIETSFSGYFDDDVKEYESNGFQLLAGKYPSSDNEITISNLVFQQLKNDSSNFMIHKINTYEDVIKYTITFNNISLQIVGVFTLPNYDTTRYTSSSMKQNETRLYTELSQLTTYSAFATVILNKSYHTRHSINDKMFHLYPLLVSTTYQSVLSLNGACDHCYSEEEIDLNNPNILWFGEKKTELQANEILLPAYAISDIDKIQDGAFDYLWFSTNSDYTSSVEDLKKLSVQPVGIYIEDDLITSSALKEALFDMFGYYGYPALCISLSGNMQQDLDLLHFLAKYNLGIRNSYQLMVESIQEFLLLFSGIMMGITLLFFIIFIFLILNYYQNIIYINRRELGVYFSLGCSKWNAIKPYMLHALYLTCFTIVLSIPLSFGLYNALLQIIQTNFSTALSFQQNLLTSFGISILIYILFTIAIFSFSIHKYFKKNNPLYALRGR